MCSIHQYLYMVAWMFKGMYSISCMTLAPTCMSASSLVDVLMHAHCHHSMSSGFGRQGMSFAGMGQVSMGGSSCHSGFARLSRSSRMYLRARALARSHCTLRTSAASSCSRRRRRSSCPLPAVLSRRLAPEPASMDPNQAPMPWRIRHAAQPSHAASSYTNTRQEGVHLGRLGFQKCCA